MRRADKSVMTQEWPETSAHHHQHQVQHEQQPERDGPRVRDDEVNEDKAVALSGGKSVYLRMISA